MKKIISVFFLMVCLDVRGDTFSAISQESEIAEVSTCVECKENTKTTGGVSIPYPTRLLQFTTVSAVLFYKGIDIVKSFKMAKYATASLGGLGISFLKKASIPFVFSFYLAKSNYENKTEEFLNSVRFYDFLDTNLKKLCSNSPYLPAAALFLASSIVGKKVLDKKKEVFNLFNQAKNYCCKSFSSNLQFLTKKWAQSLAEIKEIYREKNPNKLLRKAAPQDLKTTLFLLNKIGWI